MPSPSPDDLSGLIERPSPPMTEQPGSDLRGLVERLREERWEKVKRLARCPDLFGQMLLTGHVKRLDREIAAALARSGDVADTGKMV